MSYKQALQNVSAEIFGIRFYPVILSYDDEYVAYKISWHARNRKGILTPQMTEELFYDGESEYVVDNFFKELERVLIEELDISYNQYSINEDQEINYTL
jgi:hypothetical protein